MLESSGGYVVSNYWVDGYALGDSSAPYIGMGFEMDGKVREVSIKPMLDRIQEERAERVKPSKKKAKAKAREIEGIAAELALSGGDEAKFRELLDQWLAQRLVLPEQPDMDPEQLFMAQVAMRIQRIRAEQEAQRRLAEYLKQDEMDALMVLMA